jgi:hypothetical protein
MLDPRIRGDDGSIVRMASFKAASLLDSRIRGNDGTRIRGNDGTRIRGDDGMRTADEMRLSSDTVQ